MIDQYVLPGENLFPEGITDDPDGVTFYVSSSRQGTVFRGRIDRAELEIWNDGMSEALGLAVDDAGRLLVCGASTGHIGVIDTSSGELLVRQTVPARPALLNDVCVHGGSAYVTDSAQPVVWRLPLADAVGEPERWLDLTACGAAPDALHYLNGIVPTPDGTALIVAAQGTGVLWRVDVESAKAAPIDLGDVIVNGDGLVFVDDVLYVCDNSDEPDGSVRYWLTAVRLSDDATRGERIGHWERSAADTPTTAAYLDGRLYLVNSQFRADPVRPPFTVTALRPPIANGRSWVGEAG